MSQLQTDNHLQLLCVNDDIFTHHPIKLTSYDSKLLYNQSLMAILIYLQIPRTPDQLINYLNQQNFQLNANDLVEKLQDYGFIKSITANDEIQQQWHNNGWQAAYVFHMHTNNLPKMMYNTKQGENEDSNLMRAYAQLETIPANYINHPGEQIFLQIPTIDKNNKITFNANRKQSIMTIELLSRLLYFNFGEIGPRYMRITGKHIKKTVPSGGARHPFECYLILVDVQDIACGIYHYNVKQHVLTHLHSLNQDQSQSVIKKHLLLDENRPGFNMRVAMVYSCVFRRSMFRYRESRSYRVMQYDLGHLTQNLTLLAKSYHLNVYSGYSCHEKEIEQLIGLSSISESVMAYSIL